MASTIFEEEWFTWSALAGMRSAIHGKADQTKHESALIIKLLARLLYQSELTADVRDAVEFFSLCVTEKSRSSAQIFQDLWVLLMTKQKTGGFFVEFGACDGVTLSNTLLLEREYGWTGILAEPNPVWHEKLHDERACSISTRCVHPASNSKIQFQAVEEQPELSRVQNVIPSDVHEQQGNRIKSQTIEVDTISLNDLLEQYNAPDHIDYLSIDTEGSELSIISSIDFDRRTFQLITVEHAGETDKRHAIKEFLEQHGYQRWWPEFSRWDDWYVHSGGLMSSASGR